MPCALLDVERNVIRDVRMAGTHHPCIKRINRMNGNDWEKNIPSSLTMIMDTDMTISLLAVKDCSRNPYMIGANPSGSRVAVTRRDAIDSVMPNSACIIGSSGWGVYSAENAKIVV